MPLLLHRRNITCPRHVGDARRHLLAHPNGCVIGRQLEVGSARRSVYAAKLPAVCGCWQSRCCPLPGSLPVQGELICPVRGPPLANMRRFSQPPSSRSRFCGAHSRPSDGSHCWCSLLVSRSSVYRIPTHTKLPPPTTASCSTMMPTTSFRDPFTSSARLQPTVRTM